MNDEQPPNGTDMDADESESRAALAPFAASLRDSAVWASPPAGLEAAVVERIRGAAATPPIAATPPRSRARGAIGRRLLPAVAAAAVAFVAGFAIANRDDDGTDAMAKVDLIGTELAPDASASGEVIDSGAGYAIRIEVDGLPPAPDGSYYEGWVQAGDGAMVSVGTFHMRGGDDSVVLWSGVKVGEYSTLIVTEQVEREPPDSDLRVLLEGPIDRFETVAS